MNRNFVFTLVLFIMLSIVNAIPHQQFNKRTTTYTQCEGSGSPYLTVTLQPDPWISGNPEKYTVSGTIGKNTTDNTKLYIIFAIEGEVIGDTYKQSVPNTPAGREIIVTADNVPTPKLASAYANIVAISDSIHVKDTYACSMALIGYETAPSNMTDMLDLLLIT